MPGVATRVGSDGDDGSTAATTTTVASSAPSESAPEAPELTIPPSGSDGSLQPDDGA